MHHWFRGSLMRVGMLMASLALGLASPAVHALCDACVVAAIREHKAEMMSQFKQLKEEIASGLKTVRHRGPGARRAAVPAYADELRRSRQHGRG